MSGRRQAHNRSRSLRRLLSGCVLLSSTVSVRMCRSSRSAAFRTKHTLFRSAASIALLYAGVEPSREEGGSGQEVGGGGAGWVEEDRAWWMEEEEHCTTASTRHPVTWWKRMTPALRGNVNVYLYNLHRVRQMLVYDYVTHISATW